MNHPIDLEAPYSLYPPIDYGLIGEAIDYYRGLGYAYIEVPWEIETRFVRITCPDISKILFTDNNTALIGSAEQSLLGMYYEDKIPPNQPFVVCSPCFRVNEPDDEYHFPQFMKVELGQFVQHNSLDPVPLLPNQAWEVFSHHALSFFAKHTDKEITREIITTPSGKSTSMDLMIGGVEIGSYGRRWLNEGNRDRRSIDVWNYGTGLALPRFSQAR